MKKNYIALLTAIFAVFFLMTSPRAVLAAAWVEQINGDVKAIIVVRKGNFVAAEEMMRLQPGDVIKVLDDKSFVRILLGSGAIKNISKAGSPFIVEGKNSGSSFLSNLFGEAKKMLVSSSDQTEAVAMMTRGRAKQLSIVAAGAEENMVVAGSAPLLVAWQGGTAPYKISLLGAEDDKPVVSKDGLSGHEFVLEANKLGAQGLIPGEYQLLLEGTGSEPSASRQIDLLLVERAELPANAQRLLGLKLDKRVEARLLINLLHKQPEWRFFAHNLAVRHALEKERSILLQMK